MRGEGAHLFDQNGTVYLDFTSGIGVTNTGHCHPRVVAAVQRQAGQLLHGQANIIWHPALIGLAEELRAILPSELDGFFFSNSGAEAVEGAVKLARAYSGRPNVIVFQGSFHGRTVATMAMTTSKTIYRSGYQPLMPGVFTAPFPYAFRFGWEDGRTSDWCLDELEFLLTTQTSPDETAAIMIEPVLGEGGYVPAPRSFLKGLRTLASQYGILLIFDEVQTGFGRVGEWFAMDHYGVTPDILVLAKGLASGLPISGVISRSDVMARWTPGSHGGTYGGNAVAAAAGIATIQTIRDEGLLENAQARGKELITGLRALQSRFPQIGDVRGIGAMIACEFRTGQRDSDKATAKAVIKECFNQQLLLLTCGPWDNTIRFIPPLVVNPEQVEAALRIFEAALDSALHSHGSL